MDRRTMICGTAALVAGGVSISNAAEAADSLDGETCADGCGDCRTACLACVDSCLDEAGRKNCVKLCLDCADICAACDAIAARKGPMAEAIIALCAEACDQCAAECEKHKNDPACQTCAKSCRECARECREAIKKK